MRIDKYLWSVRVYKSRSLANEAIKRGRVALDGVPVKPAKEVEVGDILSVRKPPLVLTLRIEALPKSRVGAKLVSTYMTDLTPESEYAKLRPLQYGAGMMVRDAGSGRPTKRERRQLDALRESLYTTTEEDAWDEWDEEVDWENWKP